MKERPMLFSGPMVQAILRDENPKTQTRRIVKPQPHEGWSVWQDESNGQWVQSGYGEAGDDMLHCPHGALGDRLWVRETWARYNIDQESHQIAYRATEPADWPADGQWRPSIHMPRWASRIDLEIIGVRVERLQEISEADACAEGAIQALCTGYPYHNPPSTYRNGFSQIWESINGSESWAENPWVWVIEFKRIKP
jgi:hypothetical protein